MSDRKLCSVIVPCMNEEEAVPVYYETMCNTADTLPELEFEFWFIDDGSSDSTLSVIKKLRENDPSVHYISFSRNFGKEAGIFAGLEHAAGDYVTIMDVDLQDPPFLLKEMYSAVKDEGYDCAAARRVDRKESRLYVPFLHVCFTN